MSHLIHKKSRFWRRWGIVLLLSASVLALAVVPPFVSSGWRAGLMQAFAGVCHQLPGRSPHWHGVAIAVCDRCFGVYTGIVAGVAFTPLIRSLLDKVYERVGIVLVGILTPVGIDWVGPVLGLWANTPGSRLLTGAVLGIGAGVVLMAVLMHHRAPSEQPDSDIAVVRR